MTRILSVWLPHLAIERWARSSDYPPDAPVVLTVEGPHGLLIHAITKAAAERGARPGARLTDARALDPALIAVTADPAGDAALVQRLAKWAGHWSPLLPSRTRRETPPCRRDLPAKPQEHAQVRHCASR